MSLRGSIYTVVAAFLFGLGPTLIKVMSIQVDALVTAFLCLVWGGILVLGYSIILKMHLPQSLATFKANDWRELLLLACPGTALPLLFIFVGFTQTSALIGGLLLQLSGVAALAFATLLLRDRICLKQSLGVILLLLGGTLLIFKWTRADDLHNSTLGNLLILAGTIGIGFSIVPAKRLASRIDPLHLTTLRLLLGSSVMLPVVILYGIGNAHTLLWHPSLSLLWAFPLYVITQYCLGWVFQQQGLRLLKAWESIALGQTSPLFSTGFALLLLNDTITLVQAFGGLLILLGGMIVALGNRDLSQTAQLDLELDKDLSQGDLPSSPHIAHIDTCDGAIPFELEK
jgi:drug/metabolite transporter (DMT)-like permease